MAIYDAKVNLPDGISPPDPWDDSFGKTLPPDHVISRNEDGKPLSYARDFVWNWTPYDPRGKKILLYFDYWSTVGRKKIKEAEITPEREVRIRELQYLMVRMIYREEGTMLSGASLRDQLKTIRHLARFAEAKACSVQEVLEHRGLFFAFTESIPDSMCISVITWLNFLRTIDFCSGGVFERANLSLWRNLQDRAKRHTASTKQHAPLPTRVYSAVINGLSRELDDIDAHKDRLLGALRDAVPAYEEQCEIVKSRGYPEGGVFSVGPGIISRYNLEDFLSRWGAECNLRGLSTVVAKIFQICKLQIHVFSGMRSEEAQYLPFHCMEYVKLTHGRKHCLIAGVTTKLEGSRLRRTKWVTTESDGFRAIRLAQQFAGFIYEIVGASPSTAEGTKDNYPLFVSPEYLPWRTASFKNQATDYFVPVHLHLANGSDDLKKRLCPIIEEADIVELEETDPFRAWRDEPEFQAGQPWPLRSHQLRRSLALYANASGLVRLSSLRRQLQHITREMAQYYGRGSEFARNFIAEDPEGYKKHIAVEWQNGEQEAQYLAFVHDVLSSDEPLHGSAGTYYTMQKMRGEVVSLNDIQKQIKMGRLAYHSGPLGGCTNPGMCESAKGLRLIDVTCATEGCKHLVGMHSKIIRTIRFQRAAMNRLDPNSITYQVEKEDLDALEATEALWRRQDNAINDSHESRYA